MEGGGWGVHQLRAEAAVLALGDEIPDLHGGLRALVTDQQLVDGGGLRVDLLDRIFDELGDDGAELGVDRGELRSSLEQVEDELGERLADHGQFGRQENAQLGEQLGAVIHHVGRDEGGADVERALRDRVALVENVESELAEHLQKSHAVRLVGWSWSWSCEGCGGQWPGGRQGAGNGTSGENTAVESQYVSAKSSISSIAASTTSGSCDPGWHVEWNRRNEARV